MKKLLLITLAVLGMSVASVSAHAIVIGTDFSDWSGITGITDPNNDGTGGWHDLTNLKITHDDTNVYFYYREEQNFGSAVWIMHLLVDSDNNSATGYDKEGRDTSANYFVQGNTLYRNLNLVYDPTNLGAVSYYQSGKEAELAFPRSYISGSQINVALALDQGGGTEDWIPNSGVIPYTVPEPASLLLLGSGLIGLIGFVRKKK